MTYDINLDYAIDTDSHDDALDQIIALVRAHHGRVVAYAEEGPGGGLPNATVRFHTYSELVAYLREYCGDDETEVEHLLSLVD